MEIKIRESAEKKEIIRRYKELLKACRRRMEKGDKETIRKAFDLAVNAHKDMRRKSGEPYIYHPIAVAQICAEEIGLGTTSIVCALLHDTVEDTEITLDDLKGMFGEKITQIIDGLTKISGVFDHSPSMQAENFRKMLLTLSADIRVILIKLADRLHNMRTLEAMSQDKQVKIASETLYLYAPLAHRLGLNLLKSDLEDLGLKFTNPEKYNEICARLLETAPERKMFIDKFIDPIKQFLKDQHFEFEIFGRPKSIYSIYNKINQKGVAFDEIYDLFAIRIVIKSASENEKSDCWKVYSIITDFYQPSPERLRDWISTPKANGYESLHTTVMSPEGKWVEVQIRSERMNEIAEKGYAAHWKYKDTASEKEHQLEDWLKKIREMLENPEENALEFIDDFKLNLFAEEIFVFTPKGEMRTIPMGCTALDFAFDIHTKIGVHAIGAKVNHKLVPLSYPLKSGDQVEILSSSKRNPEEIWLTYVTTAKAKGKIKQAMKERKKISAVKGRELLEKKFYQSKIDFTVLNIQEFADFLNLSSSQELFHRMGEEEIGVKELREFKQFRKFPKRYLNQKIKENKIKKEAAGNLMVNTKLLTLDTGVKELSFTIGKCCNPIPGDDVFGHTQRGGIIEIHRQNCEEALRLFANHAPNIVKAKWKSGDLISVQAGIKIIGTDALGIVNNITKVISTQHNINMRSISFDTEDGAFNGTIIVFVNSAGHLNQLCNNLSKVKGVVSVTRIDHEINRG